MTHARAAPARRRYAALIAVLFSAATATRLPAQGPPSVPATTAPATPRREWPPPLDRRVSIFVHDTSLREALDRLAASARLRFSYSSEALPLDRVARISADSATVGDVLVELLRGVAVTPVITGPDRIVLAPARPLVSDDTARLTMARTLDRVVVTGKATGGAERALSVAVNVVKGEDLERSGSSTMSQAMDFSVPGIWLWSQSPASLLASYGSIRGASSFGVTYPKVYIDGIEVANPLLLTQIAPEGVERIEVIRGPQGAALYGADAISGVVNIITRHDGGGDGERGARLRSMVGVSQSDFAGGAVSSQEHAFALRSGSGVRTGGADISIGSLGAFYEGATSRHVSASGSTRIIGASSSFTGTARFYAKQTGASTNPLLTGVPTSSSGPGGPNDRSEAQSVKQYTLGGTLRITETERWTHAIVAGIDGYRLSNAAKSFIPFPSSTDSALRAARGGADRATLRISSVAQLADRDDASASLTLAAEQSVLREGIPVGPSDPRHSGQEWESRTVSDWLTNTGISAQTDIALRRELYLTGGLRLERSDAFIGDVQFALLPMLGASFVRDLGDVSMKLRVAYGKGIRAPRTALRETMFSGLQTATAFANLGPEEQAGVEAGLDLFVGRAFTLQLTRFDQRASGLIQQVPIAISSPPPSNSGSGSYRPRVLFELQNVGAIDNRGWEMQGTAQRGPFMLSSAVTFVGSRVRRVADRYTGDLRSGDRMVDVPAQTVSLTASWVGRSWSAVVGGARAFDWVDYDRLSLSTAAYPSPDSFGTWLRGYWREYNGATRLRASLMRSLGRGVGLVVTGDNLLGEQRGEPDNVTILPGRTVMAGIRAAF